MKFKEEPNWVVSYNQPPCPYRWIATPKKILKIKEKVSKNPGSREKETK